MTFPEVVQSIYNSDTEILDAPNDVFVSNKQPGQSHSACFSRKPRLDYIKRDPICRVGNIWK